MTDATEEPEAPGPSVRMFQIREDDLAELERVLPQLLDSVSRPLDAKGRTQFRRVQEIIKDVRWDYGPATNVEIIPADDDG